jgi:hypothetical protein
MHPKNSRVKPKPMRRVAWAMEVTPWAGAVGMLSGFGEEMAWHSSNILWMSCGALAGGLVGALCDTGIFIYRRFRARRDYATQLDT